MTAALRRSQTLAAQSATIPSRLRAVERTARSSSIGTQLPPMQRQQLARGAPASGGAPVAPRRASRAPVATRAVRARRDALLVTRTRAAPLRAAPHLPAPPLTRRSPTPPAAAQLFGFLAKKPAAARKAVAYPIVVPASSYAIPAVLAAAAGAAHFGAGNDLAAGAAGLLAAFLSTQASRVRFVFGPDALEVVIGNSGADTENAFVGGANRWAYSTFVNWEFWWPCFPVLVYFKETQTKPEGQVSLRCWVWV